MPGSDSATAPAPAPAAAPPAPAAPAAPAAPGAPAPTAAAPAAPAAVKPGEGGALPNVAAVELELKLPEGLKADEATLGKFKLAAKEAGLDSAKAQKVFDVYVETQRTAAAAVDAEIEATKKGWADSLRTDKELGGPAFDANFQVAVKALERFGTPELKTYLKETGLGGHPEFVRFFNRVGKAIAEDSVTGGTKPGAVKPSELEQLKSFYDKSPEMFQQE